MARRRYTRRRCKAKTADGKRCRKFELEQSGACGIPAHQRQVGAAGQSHKSATAQRAHEERELPKPDPKVIAQQKVFLQEYAQRGTILAACEAIGIDRKRHYEWLEDPRYPDYRRDFDAADEDAVDRWEAELVRRAVDGVEEIKRVEERPADAEKPTMIKTTTLHRYSDSLMPLLMRGRRRRVYDRRREIRHEGLPTTGPAPQVVLLLPDNGRAAKPGR